MKDNYIFSFNSTVLFRRHSQRDEHKTWLSVAGELPQQLSRKIQLPRYKGRPQVCSSSESSLDPECLSLFFSAAWATDLTCQVSAGLV